MESNKVKFTPKISHFIIVEKSDEAFQSISLFVLWFVNVPGILKDGKHIKWHSKHPHMSRILPKI